MLNFSKIKKFTGKIAEKMAISLLIGSVLLGSQAFAPPIKIWPPSPQIAEAMNANNLRPRTTTARDCFQSGTNDFVLFLETLVWSDGFYDGLAEPWNDVLIRNKCHAYDLLSLLRQQQQLRQMIRRAYLSCKNNTVAQLKKAFVKTNMEIYYVRNLVDFKKIVGKNSRALNEKPQIFQRGEKELEKMLKAKYLKLGQLNEQDFAIHLNSLKVKYAERAKKYLVCDEGSWQTVRAKWQEFEQFFQEGKSFKKASKRINDRARRIVDATKIYDENWVKSLIQINVSSLQPEDFGKNFETVMQRNNPFASDYRASDFDYSQNINNLQSFRRLYDLEAYRGEMEARYRALYLMKSDQNTKIAIQRLEKWVESLQKSFKPLQELKTCSAKINGRQCRD